jgi:hypothetical protein
MNISGRLDGTRGAAMNVEAQIAEIKANMPMVYKAIQDRAEKIGKTAYALVRRGLRGEPNCFYAFERGHVVGTPFSQGDIMAEVAKHMVNFSCGFVVIWSKEGEAVHGAN